MNAAILYLHGFCSSPQSWKARLLADAKSSKGFKDALASSADSRDGCVFPADVMRKLAASRDRAAQAAASGIEGVVPPARAGPAGER